MLLYRTSKTYWCGSGVGWLRPSVSGFYLIQESLTIFKSGEICRTLGVAEGCSSLLRLAGLLQVSGIWSNSSASGVDCRFSDYRSPSTSDFWGYSMDLMGRVILIRVRKLEPSGVS
ncbi:hypothetical protein QL285_031951 [Trifolium repens]|nr:hypothetical protein QL285_031951 [Trifolium repens]